MNGRFSLLGAAALVAAGSLTASAAVVFENYYESTTQYASCPTNSFSCRADFPRVATSRPILVKRISCYISRSQPIENLLFGIATEPNGLSSRQHYIPVVANSTGDGTYYYNISQEMNVFVRNNQYPFISIFGPQANGSRVCTITAEIL